LRLHQHKPTQPRNYLILKVFKYLQFLSL